MRIIEGLENARKYLARRSQIPYGTISSTLRKRLKELAGREIEPEEWTRQIINEVAQQGDTAVRDYTLKIDGIQLKNLEVSRETIKKSFDNIPEALLNSINLAAERIRLFHQQQKKSVWHEVEGKEWGQIVRPLSRVGFYIPGGTASYPSTVLATVIPAKVAGVQEIIMTTPPRPDGTVPDTTLIAAEIAGVNRVFSIGGAQAIAAMAFGTETVPKVDKICGPGNIFVMLAKKQVFGITDIDALQGPSEVMVIADQTAKPSYCAADLLAQAEHDTMAQAIMVTTSKDLAEQTLKEIEKQIATLPRKGIASEALSKNGIIAVVASIEEGIELSNDYAPEHLELMISDPDKYLHLVTNAGCVFLGEYSTEPIGDYVAGPSHALPTGGTARFSSPLNIIDFIKIIDIVKIDRKGINSIGQAAINIARAEGLEAHARAVEKRLEE